MSKLSVTTLVTGQSLFQGKDTGMIFYPALPKPLQGTKEMGRPDFDITHPDNWPKWCKSLHTEHAAIEVRDGWVIWWGGTVHDGIWMGDEKTIWMGGRWRDGIVLGGHFFNCDWVTGEKRGGDFHSGIWHGGLHRGGSFSGLWLSGAWLGGEFNGFRERTTEPPPMVTGNACIY